MSVDQIPLEGRAWSEYRSHKVVRAAHIVEKAVEKRPDGLTWLIVEPQPGVREMFRPTEAAMIQRVDAGDYALIYADGFKSVSPAKAFEEGYSILLSPDNANGRDWTEVDTDSYQGLSDHPGDDAAEAIDYRELLLKYIAHVGNEESVNFINRIRDSSERKAGGRSFVEFTSAEAEEMRRLNGESEKFLPEWRA